MYTEMFYFTNLQKAPTVYNEIVAFIVFHVHIYTRQVLNYTKMWCLRTFSLKNSLNICFLYN